MQVRPFFIVIFIYDIICHYFFFHTLLKQSIILCYIFIKDDYKLVDQQKVLLELFELMKEHDGFTPKEFKPRAD